MDKKNIVVISTIYEGYAVKQAIAKLSPDKLILVTDEPKDKKKRNKMEKVIKTIKEFFKETIFIEVIKIPSYNIPKIIEKIIKIIDKESKKENKILIHTTEGRKTISLGLLFAAYRRKEKIKGAYYITEEEHKLISLPLINFSLGESKKKLLKEIAEGNGVVHNIEKKLKLKPSAIYQHVQELKREGYIEDNKELKLTDLGRIMVL